MIKLCKNCNTEKELSEFYYNKTRNYYYPQCKPCKIKYNSKYPNKGAHKPDGYYYVYALPNAEYYIGKTKDLNHRLSNHKYMEHRDVTDVIKLHKCDTDEEALWYEAVYHKLGFPGKHNPIPKKYRHKKTSH
jgi:predicted GIY-YIG superfamily endonuclease